MMLGEQDTVAMWVESINPIISGTSLGTQLCLKI